MKKIYLSILVALIGMVSFATTHTVTNSGMTFNPDSIAIQVGDSIDFNIAASHDVKQYEEKYYDDGSSFSSGNVTGGGFNLPLGGGTLGHIVFYIPGTYYYVCEPHFNSGMKAKITVEQAPPVSSCSELFFSQYMEGSGNNKAIEIYNPTSSSVDLSLYTLVMYNNGGNNVNTLALTGTIAANSTYVISKSGSDVASIADLVDGIINHNGDDAYALVKNGVGAVDILAYFDEDPGSSFSVTGGSLANNTLIRKNTINAGTTDWSVSMGQWDVLPSNDTTGFGSHTMTPCITGPVVSFKTDSFTFNEGDGTIHLDSLLINPAITSPSGQQFEIHLHASSTASFPADFTVNAGVPVSLPYTHTIASALFNFTSLAINADLVDDAIYEGDEIVMIVLRNAVNGLSLGADSILYVTIIDNEVPSVPTIELASTSISMNENGGTFDITVNNLGSIGTASDSVKLQIVVGDAADVDNYMTTNIIFDGSATETVTITITDDVLVEGTETVIFALLDGSTGMIINSDSIFTLTIIDNEAPLYPEYPIELIRGNDTDAIADSIGVKCWTSGVVVSDNFSGSGMEFFINNGIKGIGVYVPIDSFGYTITEGDEIKILGTVTHFKRLSQMGFIDTIIVLSTGNTIAMPTVVTDTLGEYTESEIITLENATYVSGTWGDNKNVIISANGKEYSMRIDDQSGVGSLTQPTGFFDVIGIGAQYNNSTSNLFKGYQIKPRRVSDIILKPTLNMTSQGTSVNEDAGTVTIEFEIANYVSGSYTVDVALTSGDATDIANFTTQTAVSISGGTGTITVTVTDDTEIESNEIFTFELSNPSTGLLLGNGKTFELTVTDNDADAITEINVNALSIYPNPSSDLVNIEMYSNENQLVNISIIDLSGKQVIETIYSLSNGKNVISLDLSKLSKGNYILNFATENGSHSSTLMVK